MYSISAEVYDLIHGSFKDYASEAAEVARIVRDAHPHARTILDVACGTAEHARVLTEQFDFQVDGLDLNPEFVRLASMKLPHGRVFEGDMSDFQLNRRYDVILCLFSSIGYVRTLENVARTLACFRRHLEPDGVLLVEPWFAPNTLEPGRVFLKSAEGPNVSVSRMSLTEMEGRLSRSHFEYLIGRSDGIVHASEIHELGLFTTEELLGAFHRVGFRATHDPEGPYGRGLFLARPA